MGKTKEKMDQNKLLDNFLNFSRRGAEGTKQSWNS
jgi:hypothetical protein